MVIAPWEQELGKNGNNLRVTCVRGLCWQFEKKERGRSQNLRESQKSDVLTSWCFLPKQMCCCVGWMVRGEEKKQHKTLDQRRFEVEILHKTKKTTPNCEHIHILSTLKPPTKQEGIPQNYCTFAWYDSPKVGNLVIPEKQFQVSRYLLLPFFAATWLAPLKAFAWVRVFRSRKTYDWFNSRITHTSGCVWKDRMLQWKTLENMHFVGKKKWFLPCLEDIQPLKRTPWFHLNGIRAPK